tara:strand:+ start:367 stop:534 length:168 start_codon:yes stop_codon:yes gene_type:complete
MYKEQNYLTWLACFMSFVPLIISGGASWAINLAIISAIVWIVGMFLIRIYYYYKK